jgi:hypothetical protein
MNTLFDQESTIQIDPNKDYLSELVGEGKKFKSVEDLARGKFESDVYIDTLTRRQDEINKDYRRVLEESKTQAALKDMMKEYQSQFNPDRIEDARTYGTINRQNTQPVNDLENKAPIFDRNELRSLVSTELLEYQKGQKEKENFAIVQKKLHEQFGPNYQEVLRRTMDSLNLSTEDIDSLAKKSPAAFFNTLGLNQTKSSPNMAPPRTQRNDSFSPQSNKKRTWSYYQDLKKQNPMAWTNPKIAVQMQEDHIALGDEFEDGDFHPPQRTF